MQDSNYKDQYFYQNHYFENHDYGYGYSNDIKHLNTLAQKKFKNPLEFIHYIQSDKSIKHALMGLIVAHNEIISIPCDEE